MVRVKFSETFSFLEGVSLGSKNVKLTWTFERAFMTVHGYVVVNFSQIILIPNQSLKLPAKQFSYYNYYRPYSKMDTILIRFCLHSN